MKYSLLLATLLFLGCASTSVIKTGSNNYPSKPSDCNVQVINQFPKDQKYEEIAIINSQAGGSVFNGQGLDSLLPEMKEKACEVGADALVLKSSSDSNTLQLYSGKRGEAQAIAIKYL